jgi:hypothetical protein
MASRQHRSSSLPAGFALAPLAPRRSGFTAQALLVAILFSPLVDTKCG